MLRSAHVLAELKRALLQAGRREIGGLLLENSSGDQRIHLAPNLASDPGALEVPGWWLARMLDRPHASGFRPVAFLHSHLTTLEPSDTDLHSMKRSALPWIILRYENEQLTWVTLGT